jgi:DNA-binding HxlR family transcriptional regulator
VSSNDLVSNASAKHLVMRHKSLENSTCPIARSIDRIGEWWTVLILRDAARGMKRFQEFQESLGITPNILSKRLSGLVSAGIMERRQYSVRPPRFEYLLTERGRYFGPVLTALREWETTNFDPRQPPPQLNIDGNGRINDPRSGTNAG